MRQQVGILLCLVVMACSTRPTFGQGRSPAATAPSDVVAGQRVFDAQCAWCHGAGGDGGTGPSLRGKLRHATDRSSIVSIVIAGIPGTEMPSFRSPLTERSARQVATYVQSLSRVAATPVPGDPKRGAALYASAGCGSCHVISGRGTALGPELTSIGALRGAPHLRESIVTPEAVHPSGYLVVRAVPTAGSEVRGIRVNEDVFWIHIRDAGGTVHSLQKADLSRVERELEASLMPSYASRLSAAELDDVVSYLAGLRGAK